MPFRSGNLCSLLLPVSLVLTALGTSRNWSHTVFVLLFLDYFTSIVPSGFTHVVAGASVSFFVWLSVSLLGWTTLWVLHPQVDTGVPTSWLLGTWVDKHLLESLLSLLGQHPEMGLVGQKVICCLTFCGTTELFSTAATSFSFTPAMHRGSSFSVSLPTLVFFSF